MTIQRHSEDETRNDRGGQTCRPSGSGALAALASSALALPGLAPVVHADSPTEKTTANFNFSYYKERNLEPGKYFDTGSSSRERFQIFAYQFNLLTPINTRTDASFDLTFETMSGASPWWVVPDAGGTKFLQVMSGATIEDRRVDGQITLNRYFDRTRMSATGGVSSEKDYLSGNFGFGIERGYNDRNTTLGLAMLFTWDTIRPTDFASFNRLPEYSKETFSINANIAQILYRNAIVRAGISYKNLEGFLSDPYKRVLTVTTINGSGRPDSRPTERHQLTFSGSYRQFISKLNAALHVDAAYYWDNWDVNSLSLEAAWYQTVFGVVQLVPMVRYYSQSSANFYGPVFANTEPVFATSDYRLSAYGAISYGIRADVNLPDIGGNGVDVVLSVGYQHYQSGGDLAIYAVPFENPGLVDYNLFNAQVGFGF